MPKITPFLWFDNQAEEAAKFYTFIFKNSKIGNISRYGDGAPMPKGTALVVPFELDGQAFSGLNGGPMFKFSEAVSFSVACQTQEEIDYFWTKLGEGGQEQQCGWLKDKFGLSWQIVPAMLQEWASDPQKMGRVMPLIMGMVKIDIPTLEKAARG